MTGNYCFQRDEYYLIIASINKQITVRFLWVLLAELIILQIQLKRKYSTSELIADGTETTSPRPRSEHLNHCTLHQPPFCELSLF